MIYPVGDSEVFDALWDTRSIVDLTNELFDIKGELIGLGRFNFLVRILHRTIKTFEDAGKRVFLLYDMPRFEDGVLERCLLFEKPESDACASNGAFIMDFEKFWWIFGGFWWILVEFGGFWVNFFGFLVDFGGFLVNYGGFWKILVDFWWILVDLWWILVDCW